MPKSREQKRLEAEARNLLTDPARRARARRECPTGKRKLTEREARIELVGACVDRNRGRNHRKEQRFYVCPFCGSHHLTSTPERKPA